MLHILCCGTTQQAVAIVVVVVVLAKLAAITYPETTAATTATVVPIAIFIMYKIIIRLTIPEATGRHPELRRGTRGGGGGSSGGRGVVVVPWPGRWLLLGRRVPRIQPRIDRVCLVAVHRVFVLVHRLDTAARRDHRHLVGRLQVLLRAVELGPGKV